MVNTARDGDAQSDPRVAEIIDIMAKETAVDRVKLTPETTIVSLGIASLDMVQAIFALETRFDVEIPVIANEAGGEFSTVGELVRHVIATIDAKGAGISKAFG